MSQQLQQTRYDQLIRRAGGLIGGGSKVSSVIPELFPILELENTTPELIALSGWRTAWQSTERPANIGTVSTSQLLNPAGSGILAVITQLSIVVTSSTRIQMQNTIALLAGFPVPGVFRDARFGVPRNTALRVQSANGPPIGGGGRFLLVANVEFKIADVNGIAVLTPGTELSISTTSVNQLMTVNYFWRERTAEASELSFP